MLRRISLLPTLLCALAFALTGCPGEKTSPEGTPPKTDTKTDPTADKATDAPKGDADKAGGAAEEEGKAIRTEAKKIKGDLVAQGKRYRQLLADGRNKVRANDYEGGIAAFQQALKDDPNDPRLLGELSWAAFQAKKLDLAERAGRDCTKQTRDGKLLGACWYNLGRAQEERGKKEEAAASYRESLRVRPGSKPVQERLDGLAVAAPAPAAGPVACGGYPCEPVPNLKTLCDRLSPVLLENAGGADDGSTGVTCNITASRNVNSGALLKIAVLNIILNAGSEESWYILAMQTEAGWAPAGDIGYAYNPGAFGIYEEATLNLTLKDVLPGEPTEIVVDTVIDRHDTDMGVAEYEDVKIHMWTICGLLDGKPGCYKPIPRDYSYTRDVDHEAAKEIGVEPAAELPQQASYVVDASFPEPGKIKLNIRDIKGTIPDDLRALKGTFEIGQVPSVAYGVLTR